MNEHVDLRYGSFPQEPQDSRMPNPWTGIGNPYTREEVIERLRDTLAKGEAIIDGDFRQQLEETGMGTHKEVETVALARKMDIFSIVYVASPEEAKAMAEAGADVIIAHVGCTVGGSIGVTDAAMSLDGAARATQNIIDVSKLVRGDVIYLSHGAPIATPEDAAFINERTDASGFVGASRLERMAVEESLTNLTKEFKSIPLKRKA